MIQPIGLGEARRNVQLADVSPGTRSPAQVGMALEDASDQLDGLTRALACLKVDVTRWMRRPDDWPDELNDVSMHLEHGLHAAEIARCMLGEARAELQEIEIGSKKAAD